MDATSLATLWATIALVIFLAVVIYIKVPGMIAKALDARSAKISSELDEARKLRDEAQQLLGQFQRKRKEAEQEAADIVARRRRRRWKGRRSRRSGRARSDQRSALQRRRHCCRGRADAARRQG